MSGQKIWASILSDIKSQVSSSLFKTWFSGSSVLNFKEDGVTNVLTVGVKSNFLKEQVETRYLPVIIDAAKRKGFSNTKVEFVVSQEDRGEPLEMEPLFSGEVPTFINTFKKIDNLNPLHTFGNFVVGSSNNLAFLAFRQVSSTPGSAYNPLFVYGDTGVGKTHLLQACGNEVLSKIADAKVLYVSAERFTNDYIESLNNRTQAHFRQKYRSVDVLLVDDVQFLAGKESTQDEFFYTFNELFLSGRQIVLACDRHPKDLGRLKDRLVSRFLGGMMVDVGKPDLELRTAIIKGKCREKNIVLPDEIISYIAESCSGSVRELEGILVQVLSLTRLSSGGISFEEIKAAVSKNSRTQKVVPEANVVVGAVSRHFKISKEDLCGTSRKSNLVYARQVLMFLLRFDVGLTLGAIGEKLGGRDHSTIIYGAEKIQKLSDKSQITRDEIFRVRARFQQN